MTYHNYEWTAFRESDLLKQGDHNLDCGDSFVMSGTPTVTMKTCDDDGALSGSSSQFNWSTWRYDTVAGDSSGQKAYVDGSQVGDQMYAEQYHVLTGSDGKTYYLLEINVECHDAPGAGDSYFTFYGATPPAGVTLTVSQTCSVSGSWVDYSCLGAGDMAPPNTPPHFTNVPSQGCLTVDENTRFVIDLNSADAEGDAVTYSIAGGADAHLFEIDAQTGELSFKVAPDYETKADYDCNGIYDVKVKVTDAAGGTDVKALCVKVEDDASEPETGIITGRFYVDADCNGSEWNDVTCNWDGAVPNAKVELLDLNGNVVSTTNTDAHGNYKFEAPTGQYYVRFAAQEGKTFIAGDGKDLGNGETADMNNGDAGVLGLTDVITLTKGGQTNIDAGVGTCSPVIGTNCMVIEAEDMDLCNFCIQDWSGASDGQYVKSYSGYTGSASTTWAGEDGSCDITVTAWDAGSNSWWSSKSETVWLYVNGQCVKSVNLTKDNCAWNDITFNDVQLNAGDKITIYACGQNGTAGIIDKVKICCDVTDPVTGKIGDTLFIDLDKDGVQDAGETGAAGVLVKLLDANGNVLAFTETDANGNYLFDNLPAGDYRVQFVPGAEYGDYVFTAANQGSDDAVDSDADANGLTDVITLEAGETDLTVDAGLAANTGSLAGTLFRDVNKNGVEDAGDERVPGKTVVLFKIVNGTPTEVGRQVTDANGDYKFTNLDAGNYVVGFLNPQTGETFIPGNVGSDDTIDSDVVNVSGGNGFTGVVTLAAGEDKTDVDAGIQDPASSKITGRLFEDTDRDGIEDAGEPGISGVTVTLKDGNGNTVGTTTTDSNGDYVFDNLPAGDYVVEFPTEVDGKPLTDSNVGSDDTVDSDADQTTGQTGTINLGINDQSDDNDAGVVTELGSLSGRYFLDQNDNSVQDAGEPGVEGVLVGLFDSNGQFVKSTATDANGNYSFGDLEPGSYSVRFQDGVSGGLLVDQNVGSDDTVDSDAAFVGQNASGTFSQITDITVNAGQDTPNNDAGVELPGSIAGRVFMDGNDNDQDDNEMGVGGVTVQLLNAAGAVVATTVTAADGSYSFDNLAPGTYTVDFDESTTGGKTLVNQNVGPDATDSDANTTDGKTGPISVAPGQNVTDVDAGVEDPGTASIGDTVFFDANGNGVRDNGEAGVEGVTVTLTGAGADGQFGTADDTSATTTTDANGNYLFDGLDAGDYKVTFLRTGDAAGLNFTTEGAAADDAVNNDSDANAVTGMTDTISLDLGEAERDIDAGLVDPAASKITGRLFEDTDKDGIEDAGEPGIGGVTVTLKDGNGNTVGTTTTDSNGDYVFDNLPAGDYVVEFPTDVDGKPLTDSNVGSDDTVDSDADQTTGQTGTINLGINDQSDDNDAGVVTPNTPPAPQDDTGMICANTELTLDVLANDTDAEGDSLTVTQVNGQNISEGQTVVLDGVNVTLSGGKLVFDGDARYESLDIGEKATVSYTYTVSDGTDVGTANAEVTFCGTAETLQDICESLPTDLVTFQIRDGALATPQDDTSFTVKLQSSDARLNGLVITDAYCIDLFDSTTGAATFEAAPELTGNIYCATNVPASTLEGQMGVNGQSAADNLDLVSWIINQDYENTGTYSGDEVQAAIWQLTNKEKTVFLQAGGDPANVQAIVEAATANGEGFVAGEGDRVALVIDPNPSTTGNEQPIIIGVEFADLDCLC